MLSLKSLRGDKDEAPNVEATKSVVQNEDTSDVICGIKDETIKDGIIESKAIPKKGNWYDF